MYNITELIIDQSNAGLITELKEICYVTPFNFRESGQEATLYAVKFMDEKKAVIHEKFKDLIFELQAARFNEKGTVDKGLGLTMDLFDAYIMALHKLKTSRLFIVKINTR